MAYSPRGIGKEFNTGPLGRQGGLVWGSIGLQRAAPPSLLPQRTTQKREEHARQSERAEKGRGLHDIRVKVMVSESAHDRQAVYHVYQALAYGAKRILPPRPGSSAALSALAASRSG